MLVEIGTTVIEGFVNGIVFRFNGELILCTREKLAWVGKANKDKIIAQARELIAELKAKGFDVVGEEELEGL